MLKPVAVHETCASDPWSYIATFRWKMLYLVLAKLNVHQNAKRQDFFWAGIPFVSSLLHICKGKRKLCTFACSKVCFEFVAYSLYPINANRLTMQGTSECQVWVKILPIVVGMLSIFTKCDRNVFLVILIIIWKYLGFVQTRL